MQYAAVIIGLTGMHFITKYKLVIIGVAVGALGGYLYYSMVGCASGTCPITSKPLTSSLYGATLGGLLLSSFTKGKTKSKEEHPN